MRANYGYKDGSGEYFITIETDACVRCAETPCVQACPADVLEIIADDYDDRGAAVTEDKRHRIKYVCAPCKPASSRPPLPCVEACPAKTIAHSW